MGVLTSRADVLAIDLSVRHWPSQGLREEFQQGVFCWGVS